MQLKFHRNRLLKPYIGRKIKNFAEFPSDQPEKKGAEQKKDFYLILDDNTAFVFHEPPYDIADVEEVTETTPKTQKDYSPATPRKPVSTLIKVLIIILIAVLIIAAVVYWQRDTALPAIKDALTSIKTKIGII